MDRRLRRAADHERKTGRALGSRRTATIGSRKSEADVAPIEARGVPIQAECKSTKRPPAFFVKGLAQARRYNRAAHPMLVVRAFGGGVFVVMELDTFVAIAGIEAGALPTTHRPTRRDARQLTLEGVEP